jgi:hypothetical protein
LAQEIAGADRQQPRCQETGGAEAWILTETVTQAEIDIVVPRINQPVGGLDMQLQFGISGGETSEPRHQPTTGQRGGGADPQRTAPAWIAHRCPGAVDALEAVEQRLQQTATCLGEMQRAVLTLEQLLPEALLQMLDLLADRPRRHMQGIGCRLHAAEAASFDKGAQRQKGERWGHLDTLV